MAVYYYAARFASEHESAFAAIRSVGYTAESAERIIRNSEINQSPAILIDIGGGKGVAITTSPTGRVQLWQAVIGEMSEDRNDAVEMCRLLAGALGDGSALAVFEGTPPVSKARN
jgi:hypothetical protein